MESHAESVQQLLHILSSEATAYRQLVKLTEQERAALQAHKLHDLAATVQAKETLASQVAEWEAQRTRLTQHLAESLHLPATATLAELISRLDGPIAPQLEALREEFVRLMEQLLALTHGNRLLLEAGLSRVEATFGYIASLAAQPDGHYTASGRGHVQPQAAAGNMLNWKI